METKTQLFLSATLVLLFAVVVTLISDDNSTQINKPKSTVVATEPTKIASEAKAPVITKEVEPLIDLPEILERQGELTVEHGASWLSPPINPLSNELLSFIEEQQIAYVNTTFYPFNEEVEEQLLALSKQGQVLLFDNTQPEHLDNYGVSESQVVSKYFGSASDGDVIVAMGIPTNEGGIHYLVLPITTTEDNALQSDVKRAVSALKLQKQQLLDGGVVGNDHKT